MYVVNNCVHVLGEQSISQELSDAFDTMLSALAVHSQAGKEAVEEAGGIVLTRLKSIVIVKCFVNNARGFSELG